jgi:hypothetical protein
MKSENAKRNAVSENDPAIRNPFGVMDVPNPNDDDVTQFARNTAPEESATDENAKAWSAGATSYQRGAIEGEWSSRWNGAAVLRASLRGSPAGQSAGVNEPSPAWR